MTKTNEQITGVIKELAKRKGIGIHDLEVQCGLSKGSVSRWKLKGCDPNFWSVVKLCDALGVAVDALFITDLSALEEESRREKIKKSIAKKQAEIAKLEEELK